jgi:pseudouridine-5'-phosphate glycosidase
MHKVSDKLTLAADVQQALSENAPVVALESNLISHGLRHPVNLETAQSLEATVRENGATPATIAIVGGQIKVGLTAAELERLATTKAAHKLGLRDLPIAVAREWTGGTTVAATMHVSAMAGIRVLATGGIGGVHRGQPYDISADLPELEHTPLVVVCSGAKAILDLPLTMEWLETHGVPVLGYGTDNVPAFYSRSSGLPIDSRVDTAQAAARIAQAKWDLELRGGIVVAVPVPAAEELPQQLTETAISEALEEAERQGIRGKQITPFLLDHIGTATEGESVQTNVALLRNNAAIAAQIACELKEANTATVRGVRA